MKIEIPPIEENPSPSDVQFLDDRIYEYNVEQTGVTDAKILSYFIRDQRGDIIAGLYGWTWGGCCEVRNLWVRREFRKLGYGKGLLAAAEREALARGCVQIVLDTHSFQAPRLYQSVGFEIVGTFDGYPRGHKKHFMLKLLRT